MADPLLPGAEVEAGGQTPGVGAVPVPAADYSAPPVSEVRPADEEGSFSAVDLNAPEPDPPAVPAAAAPPAVPAAAAPPDRLPRMPPPPPPDSSDSDDGVLPRPAVVDGPFPPPPPPSSHADPAPAAAAPAATARTADDQPRVTFKVHDPQMTTSGRTVELAFWSYRIEAKSSLPQWQQQRTSCVRRYSDFVTLRQCFQAEFPGVIAPPVPEKDMQGTVEKFVHFDESFVEYRQRALGKFLNACGQHPLLQGSESLKRFCVDVQGETWGDVAAKRLRDAADSCTVHGTGVATKAVTAAVSQWRRLMGRGTDDAAVSSQGHPEGVCSVAPLPDGEPSWAKMLAAIVAQQQALLQVRSHLTRQIQHRMAMAEAFAEVGQELTRLADVERAQPLLRQDLFNIGKHSSNVATKQSEHALREEKRVLEQIAYWANAYQGLKGCLQQLRDVEVELRRRQDRAKDAASQRDKARPQGNHSKVAALEAELAKAKERVASQQELCDSARARFAEEWPRFWRSKREDWKQLVETFLQLRIASNDDELRLKFEPVIPCW
eukprot:TRINITY_DN1438_c0_g1_i1.p1 TRINITY_DN1438_c0_g1~~TRINITY_DN1438_c0_g1_i1.p1  ORF type:complete len:567 (+),score=217.95 TRINITY_DN1438_c0_g1_i1:58-1701(+)